MSDEDLMKVVSDKLGVDRGFIGNNNYRLLEVSNNYCKLEGILTESSFNLYGIAHGGYIFGLADTAAGIAAMSNGKKAVTLSANISYLKKARGNKLIAVTNCIKDGRKISNYEVEVFDEDNNLISKVCIEYCYLD